MIGFEIRLTKLKDISFPLFHTQKEEKIIEWAMKIWESAKITDDVIRHSFETAGIVKIQDKNSSLFQRLEHAEVYNEELDDEI